jgi:uncharacterized membrane protein
MIPKNELLVLLAAAAPVLEVRGSIPLGLYFGLTPAKTFILSVIGSIIPILPVLFGLNYLTGHLRKVPAFDKLITKLFERTRAKSDLIKKFEAVGLMLFVAVPLPGTGIWTGCVAAYLFGLSYLEGFLACAVGTAVAAVIVMAVSLGVINIF